MDDNKKTLNKLQSQLLEISNEYKYADNELKKYEENYKTLTYEKDSIFRRLEENNKDLRNKTEIINSFSKERDELSQKLRILSEDYEKLSRTYDYLNLDYKKLSTKASATLNLNESMKKTEEFHIKTIKDLEEQLRNISRSAEMADYKRIEAEKTSESLLKDIHSAKSITRDLDITKDELQRRLNITENEKNFLETRIRTLENEITNAKNSLDFEKQRIFEFEAKNIKEKEAFRRSDLDEDRTRRFIQTNSDLISELYKQIETYKSEGLKLEMAYMKLVDDFNIAKHNLHRAENRVAELESMRR